MLRRATTLRMILLKCLGYKSVAPLAAPVEDETDEEADLVCLSLQVLLLVAVEWAGAEPVVVEVVVPFPEVVVPPEVEPPPLPTNAATGGPGNVYGEPELYTLGS